MLASTAAYNITWEKLPDDFKLDDDPVDNINQPPLAGALTESLQLAGKLPANALTVTNYGICATFNGKIIGADRLAAKLRAAGIDPEE